MSKQLSISIGQYSDKGKKSVNQDYHAIYQPNEPQLSSKGIAVALADGISSSEVSQIASETSVSGFIEDYYSTPESWSVKNSVQKVLKASNSWLYAQTRNGPHRYNLDKGYVCTFSALILKSTTAHLFHVGDARVFRRQQERLEQLTEDHRLWVSKEQSYLSRALGMKDWIEIDYQSHSLDIGDTFILATDGVYEFVDESRIIETIDANSNHLDRAAQLIVEEALTRGSDDNLTIQIVRIDQLPQHQINELQNQASLLPFFSDLRPRMEFEGFEIVREIHGSSRSHVYLAIDKETHQRTVLKLPSVDLRNDTQYIERFLMEEWVAHRINNAHTLRPYELKRKRNYLYVVFEFIEGKSLAQWIIDNPKPEIEAVRTILEQIVQGLRALHRQEMLHQDLRPNNIMIDNNGTVKIIDFGSVRVAGLAELVRPDQENHLLGTAQYTAPEYFLGEPGTPRSDQFSLAVIAYQMLSGRLPYGTQVARTTTRAAQHRLIYTSVQDLKTSIPAWIDLTLRKALHPNPYKRYDSLSEFMHDLRVPNPAFITQTRPPLIERNPLMFWKGLSALLVIIIIIMLSQWPNIDSNQPSKPINKTLEIK